MRENSILKQRILQYLDFKGITKYEFYQKTGVSNGVLSQKSGLSEENTLRFLSYYDDVSPEWLLTGAGEMTKQDYSPTMVRELKTDYRVADQQIPLYDLVASAGVTEIFGASNLSVPLDYIKIPNLPKCDGALYVRGDSMYPLLKAGDIVLYKILHDKSQIIWGEMYLCHLICNGDEYFFTKFIKKGEQEGHALFVSQNTHHQPIEFPVDCIQSLALVKASVRINTQI